ncbi:MAG: endo-1,4-beta-xylanase [Phycisphaerae bacterium]|nr:endo-1,4-beta-xylanase [Phycisphaerae bacterium]
MLKFACPPTGDQQRLTELHGAHLLGADSVPARGSVQLKDGVILCDARVHEPLALSLLWSVPGFGAVQLETTRLPARPEPYILQVELARHRLMRINFKREEWGLFDYPGMDDIAKRIDEARDLFVEALEHQGNPVKAAKCAEASLAGSLWAAEQMSRFHAAIFLSRRQQGRGFTHQFLGVNVPAGLPDPGLVKTLAGNVDFVRIPFTWKDIQPKEQGAEYDVIDEWVQACKTAKLTLHGGPLLSFGVSSLPDWMYIWENDYDTVFEYAREHVRRTVERYAKHVRAWVAVSGLHASDALSLNFEHMIELTRMAATITKRAAPRSQVIIDLTQPWGEYFARNQRTVPPLLYAEMVAQSGIPFDAFGLQFLYGIGSEGYHLRDMLQISSMIDRLANLGKPVLHITGVNVPSLDCGDDIARSGGHWHAPWSDQAQADWLYAFFEIALSKPFVETVCVHTLADGLGDGLPGGGLLRENLEPKPAFDRLVELRRSLRSTPTE